MVLGLTPGRAVVADHDALTPTTRTEGAVPPVRPDSVADHQVTGTTCVRVTGKVEACVTVAEKADPVPCSLTPPVKVTV
jgi:hypothetical protein